MMKAAVLHGREDVRIESVPVPGIVGGEVLLRNHVALTCGTDVKVFRRGYHARMIVPPAIFGHEVSGVVEEIGSDSTEAGPGPRWRVCPPATGLTATAAMLELAPLSPTARARSGGRSRARNCFASTPRW